MFLRKHSAASPSAPGETEASRRPATDTTKDTTTEKFPGHGSDDNDERSAVAVVKYLNPHLDLEHGGGDNLDLQDQDVSVILGLLKDKLKSIKVRKNY